MALNRDRHPRDHRLEHHLDDGLDPPVEPPLDDTVRAQLRRIWWRLRRRGVRLPAESTIITIPGDRE